MATGFPSQEHRPLKKPRLGPPDVYPQDAKQKEDELNQMSVKQGFSNTPAFSDEYGSAGVEKGTGLTLDKFGSYFASIENRKLGLNTLQDTKKKQQIPSKDNFWPAARSKQGMEAWFKDLAGSKPLAQLSRKVPTFNKKEEIFSTLCEYSVPLVRAAWFIKMTAAHNMATQDSRIRRRQAADQSIDWTQSLTKYLREQLQKIQEFYHNGANGPQTSFLLANQHNSQGDMEHALKQWNYCTRLAKHMYNEGLLDRNETLTWLVELLEKMRNADDTVLKLLMYQIDSYIDEVTLSALLSRRLAYFCCKYLQQMCADAGSMSPRTQSPMVTATASGAMSTTSNNNNNQYHPQPPTPPSHPFAVVFLEYRNCPQHRSILMKLCGIVQTITLRCPTALVWNWLGDGKTSLFICGSPLDILPCSPSSLPMLPSDQNALVRGQVRQSESLIRQRGRAAEVNWSSDKCQQSQTGFITSKVLTVLDILDRHCFDKVDSTNSLDVLYTNIFAVINSKEGNEAPLSDEPVIRLLIDWAVSTQRTGEHRAIVTAKILERRQNEMRPEKYQDGEMGEDKDDGGSEEMVVAGVPPFQSLLMEFLDNRAPLLEEHSSEDQKQAFRNLILLFHELIQHDVFSHDAYMCTLISRGDLLCSPSLMAAADSVQPSSVKSPSEMMKSDNQDDIKVDMGIDMGIHMGMELDFSSLLYSVKEDTRSSPEPPGLALSVGALAASVKSVKSEKDLPIPSVGEPHPSHLGHSHHSSHLQQMPKGTSRHLVYATHMPIPQEDCSSHEYNQRLMVLYGVGKAREEARRSLKKTTKEIVKLYSKRNCIDVTSGDIGKVKKIKKEKDKDGKETSIGSVEPPAPCASGGSGGQAAAEACTISPANLEALMVKFQKLSYHDQHLVTSQCTTKILDQMRSFVECSLPYLPQLNELNYDSSMPSYLRQVQPIAFLFDLMQHALNLNGLMTFVVDLLKMLCEVERQLVSTESSIMVSYTTKLCLRIVGVLRRYSAYFLASRDIASQVFTSLMEALKVVNVCNPVCCSTEERNMLSFLFDCYTNCSYLKRDYYGLFNPAYTRMTTTLYAQVVPSKPNHSLDTAYMIQNIRGQFDLDYETYKLLDHPPNRYSFVCNVLLEITQSTSTETLNKISIYCAQLTARVPALTSDWLGVLRSLCCSSNHESGFLDVLTQIDVSDLSLHDNIAVFTAILVSRHCFSMPDFIIHIALPSLLAACPSACEPEEEAPDEQDSGGDQDAEPGARLSCHLLLRLFKPSLLTSQQSAGPYTTKIVPMVQEACDRQLLEASHGDVGVGPLSAILKAMLILGDETNDGSKKQGSGRGSESNISSLLENLVGGDVDMDAVLGSGKSGMESKGLNDFAKHALQEICQQEWVRDKFLKDVDHLFTSDLLIDPMLSNKQNLDQWSLRVSYLELKLMLEQATTQAETNSILDHIARATIDLFHQQTEIKMAGGSSPQEEIKSSSDQETVWLVAPLISRLPSAIQGKVLKLAGQVLESGNNLFVSAKSKQEKDRNLKNQSLLGHQPFLSLVQTCLKGQDEQREGLLNSLMSQLEKFINNTKEILEKTPDESKIRMHLHEALRLRLSLVGAMFDTIQRSNATTSDWAMLLLQLIGHEVVDCQTNSELFYTVIDMLSVLVHGTLISDGQEKLEDNKKVYHNLIKKLKKELGDKHTDATDRLRQLLPVPKRFYEVISAEPFGTQDDSKGSKMTGFDSIVKKQGLQVGQKMKMSPWEVIEGHKNPAPISWSFFGAVRLEKKTLTYEDHHRQLMYHTHSLRQPDSHYWQPPPLPPEELQPPPVKEEEKPKEIVDVQTQENNRKSSKNSKRRARNKQPGTSNTYLQQPGQMRPYGYQQEPMYPPPGPNPHWYASQQTKYGYPPQMAQRPRFTMPGGPTKTALNSMIHHRLGSHAGHIAQPGAQNMYIMQKQHNQSLLRQHILSKNRMIDPGMYAGGGTMAPNPTQPMGPMMGQPQAGYYRSMPGQQQAGMMDPMSSGMVSPGFSQASYSTGQGQPMMQGMAAGQQGGYMPQQPMAQGQQFPASGRMPAQMAGGPAMATPTTGMSGMSGYSQMGPGPATQGSYMGQMTSAQQLQRQQQQQQLRQQQMIAMQQQQQQQQQQPQQPGQPGQPGQPAQPMQQQQQQTAALVAQLQRRMSSGMPPGPPTHAPQAPPHFNSYPQGF